MKSFIAGVGIIAVICVFAIGLIHSKNSLPTEQTIVDCNTYYDSYNGKPGWRVDIISTTTEACRNLGAKQQEREKVRDVASLAICGDMVVTQGGMSAYSEGKCVGTNRTYQWNGTVWEETEDSKLCADYKSKPLSLLPIACYGYYSEELSNIKGKY